MHQLPFDKSNFISSQPLEPIHSDVWGPSPMFSVNDFKYHIVFVDDFTKFTWTYLRNYKSDVLNIFKYFKATAENQFDLKTKTLRTDGVGEFTYNAFIDFCSSNGIIHHLSSPHTPQKNGVIKRKHRHLIECSLTMLSHFELPLQY